MKKTKLIQNRVAIFLLSALVVFSVAFTSGDKTGGNRVNKPGDKAGDSYLMQINNIVLPINREGVIADVQIGSITGGQLDNIGFLFSSGFFVSGKTNGVVWANAVASASRIQDYQRGTYATGSQDPRAQLYVVNAEDQPFGQSWQDWKDAVALGANFYDGDGDGVYNPVDKNGNGVWDPDEDMPDLLGDETVWCVYHDGVNPSLRRFNDVNPQGIEIRQTVFGFASKGLLGNIVFVRYEMTNTGSVADVLDSVYFGVWADPDLGDYTDDLVGCDTTLDAGFVYNSGPDAEYGPNPPCFLIDFFQGPIVQTGNPGDVAYDVKGQIRGVDTIPGAVNLGISSFVHYMQSHPTQGDPATRLEARNYMLGFDKNGDPVDPCTWTFGAVRGGVPCADVNRKFMYSGDPVANVGWINTFPVDQRQMSNTGPFQLKKNETVTITAAYIVGRSGNALASVTQAKKISNFAQTIYDNNFRSPQTPPTVRPVVETSDDFIDIIWDTDRQFKWSDASYNIFFEGFRVYTYRTNSTADVVNNIPNIKLLTTYDNNNFIENVYTVDPTNFAVENTYPVTDSTKLDSLLYSDPSTGRIRLRISEDPFTGGPLIKGKPYYFAVTAYGLNYQVLINRDGAPFGTKGDYLIDPDAIVGASENIPQLFTVVLGEDIYSPPTPVLNANKLSGRSTGEVGWDGINKPALTGDSYEVTFKIDSSTTTYSAFWSLKNLNSGQVLRDSSKSYTYGSSSIAGNSTEGFITRVKDITGTIGTSRYEPSAARWYKAFDKTARGSGVFYVGNDIPQGSALPTFISGLSNTRSTVIKADRLRRVEIRFGQNGKAYRYLNNYVGANPIAQRSSYVYAGGVTSTDPNLGKPGEGYVDVPFTAWVLDSSNVVDGVRQVEERQLAVGFIETKNGTPDGLWAPGDSIGRTFEYIVVFDSDYDPNGQQVQFTGGDFQTGTGTVTRWADLRGYDIPTDAQGVTAEQRRIAKSGFFNAMFVVGLEQDQAKTFGANEKMVIPISVYPYANNDKYIFSTRPQGELSDAEKKALFDRVNVYPNPLFGFNPATSYTQGNPDEPFVTFTNLPTDVTIKIFTLSGTLVKTLSSADKSSPTSPFLPWNLQNENGLRVASGLYLAIVSSPGFGEKILKFSIILPQKQIQRF